MIRSRSRYDRDLDATRSRYVTATIRLGEAMRAWRAAAVPLEVPDGAVPPWTPGQAAATERVAAAWAELVTRRRHWDAMLRELGHQR